MEAVSSFNTSHEFTEEQNAEFRAAAYWMGIMGRIEIFFSGIYLLTALAGNFGGLIGGAIGIIVGIWTLRAAEAFRRVADAAGGDIENVMEAVVNLKKLYQLQAILLGVCCAFLLFAVFAALAARLYLETVR